MLMVRICYAYKRRREEAGPGRGGLFPLIPKRGVQLDISWPNLSACTNCCAVRRTDYGSI